MVIPSAGFLCEYKYFELTWKGAYDLCDYPVYLVLTLVQEGRHTGTDFEQSSI